MWKLIIISYTHIHTLRPSLQDTIVSFKMAWQNLRRQILFCWSDVCMYILMYLCTYVRSICSNFQLRLWRLYWWSTTIYGWCAYLLWGCCFRRISICSVEGRSKTQNQSCEDSCGCVIRVQMKLCHHSYINLFKFEMMKILGNDSIMCYIDAQ